MVAVIPCLLLGRDVHPYLVRVAQVQAGFVAVEDTEISWETWPFTEASELVEHMRKNGGMPEQTGFRQDDTVFLPCEHPATGFIGFKCTVIQPQS